MGLVDRDVLGRAQVAEVDVAGASIQQGPFFLLLFGSKFWIPEQKMARKNVSANQNGEGGGKWEW